MNWTTPADLRAELLRQWERGEILAALAGGEPLFPRKMRLKTPSSRQMSEEFEAVRGWIGELRRMEHVRLVMRRFRHPLLGDNEVPDEVWIDSPDEALALIGKKREANRFAALAAQIRLRQPLLLPWLRRRPLRLLEIGGECERMLDVVQWMQAHPRPAIWLRQIDLPGIHSKFVEAHRGLLAEWLDLVLPPEAIDASASGIGGFARRYGFREKPERIRFRMLDPACNLLPGGTMQDMTLDAESFAALDPAALRIVITENETNYLALPSMMGTMAIFGAGYGFEALGATAWLHRREVHYWGDLDTHGFAILDQLRSHLPHVRSLLMDRTTLLAHEPFWGEEEEPKRCLRDLPRLTVEESTLYNELRDNRIRPNLRLEQERVRFGWATAALDGILFR